MMILHSRLPRNREHEGQFWVEAEGRTLLGPWRCRGEADNQNAARANNVIEDPTRVGGDHPAGTYRLVKAVSFHPTDTAHFPTFGPWFFLLDPLDGEALVAKQQGRTGLGLHGGAPGPGDMLRATYGCLRLFNDGVLRLAGLILPLPPDLHYICEVLAG